MTLVFVFDGEPFQRVLLGYKKRGFGAGKFDGFGGKRLEGESLPAAALRELHEESGLVVEPSDLVTYGRITFNFPNKPLWDQEVHLFVAKTWCGTPSESEEMRPQWFNLDELPLSKMWDDSQYWIPYLLQRQPIQATFIMNNDNETVKEYSIRLL